MIRIGNVFFKAKDFECILTTNRKQFAQMNPTHRCPRGYMCDIWPLAPHMSFLFSFSLFLLFSFSFSSFFLFIQKILNSLWIHSRNVDVPTKPRVKRIPRSLDTLTTFHHIYHIYHIGHIDHITSHLPHWPH